MAEELEGLFRRAIRSLVEAKHLPPGTLFEEIARDDAKCPVKALALNSKHGHYCSPVVHMVCSQISRTRKHIPQNSESQSLTNPPDFRQIWSQALCDKLNATPELQALGTATAVGGYVNITLNDAPDMDSVEPRQRLQPSKPEAHDWGISINCGSIGLLECCYTEKHGTPRQGSIAPSSRARLCLRPDIPVDSLDGLQDYSHIWLVFVFHLNSNSFVRSKIRPPRLRGGRTGVFASRSPHRINPLGLSVVRLDSIQGRTLHLSGVDLVDGTPILDIKPYHPADCLPVATFPSWVAEAPVTTVEVTWTAHALEALEHASNDLDFYSSEADVRKAIDQTISLDPRSTKSTSHVDGHYGLSLDRLDIVFRMTGPSAAQVVLVDHWTKERLSLRPRMRTAEWLAHTKRRLARLGPERAEEERKALVPASDAEKT